jgi:hypothetical protein
MGGKLGLLSASSDTGDLIQLYQVRGCFFIDMSSIILIIKRFILVMGRPSVYRQKIGPGMDSYRCGGCFMDFNQQIYESVLPMDDHVDIPVYWSAI